MSTADPGLSVAQHSSVTPTMAKEGSMRNFGIAALGEFVGTFLFLLMAFGGAAAVLESAGTPGVANTPSMAWMYIATVFGFSLAINVWMFYRISGGLFNPVVTLSFVALGIMPAVKGVMLFVAQILASIAAAGVAKGLFPGNSQVQTTLGNGTSVAQGLFIEMFLTAELLFVIFMTAVEKHRTTPLAPLAIGLTLFVAHLVGVPYTGAGLNPARSFGPAVVHGSFRGHHWIYWLGPLLGAALASGFYKLMLVSRYHTANPGQDHDGVTPHTDPALLHRTGTESGYSTAGPGAMGTSAV